MYILGKSNGGTLKKSPQLEHTVTINKKACDYHHILDVFLMEFLSLLAKSLTHTYLNQL